MAKEQLGTLACLCCSREIPVKKSTGGALSACCPWCDLSAYAKDGTEAHRIIAGRMRRSEPPPGAEPTAAASGSASAEGTLPKAGTAKKRREPPSDPPAQDPAAASAATPAPASSPEKKPGGDIWSQLYGVKA